MGGRSYGAVAEISSSPLELKFESRVHPKLLNITCPAMSLLCLADG